MSDDAFALIGRLLAEEAAKLVQGTRTPSFAAPPPAPPVQDLAPSTPDPAPSDPALPPVGTGVRGAVPPAVWLVLELAEVAVNRRDVIMDQPLSSRDSLHSLATATRTVVKVHLIASCEDDAGHYVQDHRNDKGMGKLILSGPHGVDGAEVVVPPPVFLCRECGVETDSTGWCGQCRSTHAARMAQQNAAAFADVQPTPRIRNGVSPYTIQPVWSEKVGA